jgi:putative peptidoglycan lipid II flippase
MSLLKSAATVGGLTAVSRVLGFVRDIGIAGLLGSGPVADAFVVAFRFPNLFRRLFGEGAFNSAFVPLFAKRMEGEGATAAKQFSEEAFSGLFTVLLIFLLIAEIFMPFLMGLYVPGFASDAEKFDLTVLLSRIAFPYLLCMSLAALLGGVLNSLHRFWAAAAAPILLNIVMIGVVGIAIFAGWGNSAETGQALAWGVCVAGLAQLGLLWWDCRRAGMMPALRWPHLTPGVRRLVTLGIPGVIAGGITQFNLFLSTIFAASQAGANAWLYYADRIYQLPLGIVGVAIGVVLLPELARRLRAGDQAGVEASQNSALTFSMLITMPAAIGLMAMPYPIIQTLYERGAFAPADTAATAAALAAFAAGLPAFVMTKVFSPGFFAREDTRTPMYFAIVGVAVNVVGAWILFPRLGHVGIAIATTVSAWVNALLLGTTLARRGHFTSASQAMPPMLKIIAASLVMGAILLGLDHYARALFTRETALLLRALAMLGMVGLAAVIYFATAYVFGAFSPALLKRALSRS